MNVFKIVLALLIIVFIGCNGSKDNKVEESKSTKEYLIIDKLGSNNKHVPMNNYYFDSNLDSCLYCNEKGGTTVGMILCYIESTKYMDSLLIVNYDSLYFNLEKSDQLNLKQSQTAWVEFRKKESNFMNTTFNNETYTEKYGHGREMTIHEVQMEYRLVRERLIQLMEYRKQNFE